MASQSPDPEDPAAPDHHITLPQHMASALLGVIYDTRHWKKLPVRASGPIATCTWILTRQGRFPYIMLWITSLGLLLLIVVCLAALRSRPTSHGYPAPFLAAAPYRY